jgi:hypothetical protein
VFMNSTVPLENGTVHKYSLNDLRQTHSAVVLLHFYFGACLNKLPSSTGAPGTSDVDRSGHYLIR